MSSGCHLQELSEDDVPQLMLLYTEPAVREFLGGPVDPVVARARVEALLHSDDSSCAWGIRRTADSILMGMVSLNPHHDGQDIEVSYILLPEYQGYGYATEALRAVLEHAFLTLKLPWLIAETQVRNVGSVRLLERVGMRPERKLFRFGEEQVICAIDVRHSLGREEPS